MGYLLLTMSWLLRTYGAVQEKRSSINTPMIWQSDTIKTVLAVLWIVLLLIGLYLIFINNGVVFLLISLVCYFVIAPTLFGKLLKSLIEKLGF
ncbi:TPA: hypothetical protein DD690_03850 [Candidatus Daviesbacteria bacterium]|nr:MAG: hypothetical protein A3H81_01855 [Candidatus Daviesbacteria bacterium RIFCSPLOWO2_02_FULL_38_18]HBQ51089.1 hypothetical protein [Candidatus Daviesbacteria bacterium]HCB22304.1 hypothetical protein [Candidatus Daviesbacteria bacterium]